MTWTGAALLCPATPHGCQKVVDGVPVRSTLQCFPTKTECEAWAKKMGWGQWAQVTLAG